ncbi:hypothetical protein JTE90_009523 [Oedothorax gibbosus]|uniref:RNA-directed DNA polymerase n=1 Tax=Oedothorax gibbosus TaxID=931172 RepID=A0AAV6UT08_9ARAC|nr:hypothetical protein JTE90_009523 [Oedothorax gibbosus]
MPSPIDYEQIAQAQQNDPELQSLLSNSNIFHFKKINLPDCKKAIFCDLSTGTARPYIPKQFREHVFATLHNVSHSGARSTSKLVRTRFVWPSIGKDCTNWAKCCIPCQKSKIARHNKTPLGKFVDQTERFSHVHIDIVGPLPPSQNNYYCLTMIDRFTRWPEAVAIPDIRAETVAKQFYATWISRFGCPERLTTDQGRQFESALFRALSQLLGIKKLRTSPYHPQSNGLIEEFHRPMKATLKAYDTSEWAAALPTLLLGFRTAFKEDLRATSSELHQSATMSNILPFLCILSLLFLSTSGQFQFMKQAAQGSRDMLKAYTDMREANYKGADKYFHARGNFDAAKRGPGGEWAARVISNAREAVQGSHTADSKADQAANRWGRNGGDPNKFRPAGLPDKY